MWKIFDYERFFYLYWIVLTIISLVIFFFKPEVILGDGVGYYVYWRSLVFDGDINATNEFFELARNKGSFPNVKDIAQTGYVKNPWPVGLAIIWALPLTLVYLAYLFIGQFNPDILLNHAGFELPYQLVIQVSGLVAAIIFWHFTYKTLRLFQKRYFAQTSAYKITLTSLAAFLATPIIFYAFITPAWSHIYSAALLSLITYLIAKIDFSDRHTYLELFFLGVLFGLSILIRWQSLLLLPLFLYLLYVIWRKDKSITSLAQSALALALPVLILFLPQLLAWKIMFGDWLVIPQQEDGRDFFAFDRLNAFWILISPFNGMLMHPFVFFGFMSGAVQTVREIVQKKLSLIAPLTLTVILQIGLLNFVEDWHGSYGFGNRRMVDFMVLYSLGILFLTAKWTDKKLLWACIILMALNCLALIFAYLVGFDLNNSDLLEDWIATFTDPEGNYFQLVRPFEM